MKTDELILHKCGTPSYIAPEVLRGRACTLKADIFSVGSIMFNLVTSQYLFDGADTKEILDRNKKCKLNGIERRLNGRVSNAGQDLIVKLLAEDPTQRLDAKSAL